jgi:hypothetical protein
MTTSSDGDTSQWEARVEGMLQAHFKQASGPSKAGADYKIWLKRGDERWQIFVRAFLAPDLTEAARHDKDYQAGTVIGYVFDRLEQGWNPAEGRLPDLTILNPDP